LPKTVRAVVLEQMQKRVFIRQIIDGNKFDVGVQIHQTCHTSANAPKSIDGYAYHK
jgi:hypothetical protein